MSNVPIKFYPKTQNSSAGESYMQLSAPQSSHLHTWQSHNKNHLFVVNGSQLFDIDQQLYHALQNAVRQGQETQLFNQLGLHKSVFIDDQPVQSPPLKALSLAIAQKCNLGCTYCYAQQGDFGGSAKNMTLLTAKKAVDRLLANSSHGEKLNLAFMGGEPLANRQVLYATTQYANRRAKEKGVCFSFAVTTNGTLLTAADAVFFEQYGFAVTLSLDGTEQTHNSLRPLKSGKGSFARIIKNVQPLLNIQNKMQVSVRVTVTPRNLQLKEYLDYFLALGFHSVGFSPMLKSPTGQDEMHTAELQYMLSQMIECGDAFVEKTLAGERYAFANILNAMKEISKGTHRPYPCGAGAGYLGVSAEGNLFACHRFVDEPQAAMGELELGVDILQQNKWLQQRHVHQQSPCNTCWARYQCGGGCHHEVLNGERVACDFVRGWLQYCMEVYVKLSSVKAERLI
ncbi:radical SAM/SPASM domain-containing protein [Catenovulum sediminis]|uniref:SPASM domain-containing protein n=1 Tax=Catenovulum sediminis TaxID=1740262 RepID=A0ABV1RFK1_9ALTE